ncbi:hypothetical protein Lal_00012513 [Lupinus albus]|uniref:Uncharacterized protein n=1 Tax=Lupinus albus TaxID=3870 RepID=A0A6A5NER2_LUPAL|nr:hypothetical protein Lalb_Chr22g0361371 [Lupinus albus]KAF1883599.1 hypothetical protein Lal_00012513 [Lupinus albus]
MASSAEEDKDLHEKLLEAANNLLHPPPSLNDLLHLLQQVDSCLGLVEQSPDESVQAVMAPLAAALIGDELLRHADIDVKVGVASCISEITRISAPDAPLDDDQMKEAFQLIVSSFENLHDMSSRSYRKRTGILETVSKVRSCVVMLDLECDDLILEMFQHFLREIREHHPEKVFKSMQNIMTLLIEESEDISLNLLSPILDSIKKENEAVLPIAKKLVENVLESCATKLKPYFVQAVNAMAISLDDYTDVLSSICNDESGSFEQNDVHAASEHAEDESKSVREPLEESALVIKEDGKEAAPLQQDNSAAPPQQDNPVGDHSPKSVTSNGNPQATEDDTLVDSKSLEKQENTDCTVQSKGINFSASEDPNYLDTEKVENSDQKQDPATKSARETISSTKPDESSEGSYPANVKLDMKVDVKAIDSESHSNEDEKVIDSESHSKENEKVIDSGSHSKEDEKVIDSESHSKEDEKVIDSKSHSKEDEKVIDSESHSKEDEKVIDSESHSKEDEKVMDSESHSKEDEKVIDSESHSKEDEKVTDSENHSKEDEKMIASEGHSKEDEIAIDSESHSKEDGKVIDSESHSKEDEKVTDSESHSKEDEKMIASENHSKEDEIVIDSDSHRMEDDHSDQKQGEASIKIGRKLISSTKSAEPPKGSYPANVKEVEKVIDAESHSKENEKVINCESPSKKDDNNHQKQGQVTKKRGKRKPISSTKLAEPLKGSYPANVKEDEKVIDSEIHSKEDDDCDQMQGRASKRRGREPSSSTKSEANVNEDRKVIDSVSQRKEVPSSVHEDGSVEAAGLSEDDKEIDAMISSPKAGDGESDMVSSPSPGRNLHGANRSKKLGQPKKKDSCVKEVTAMDVQQKIYEETSDSEAKPNKRSVKKALGRSSDVKKNTMVNSVKKGNVTAIEPDAKKHPSKKTEDDSKRGGRSDKKRQGRGKANSESGAEKSPVKDVDKEMLSFSKSNTKSIKDEDSEELPKTNLKRKHTPIKGNESGIKKDGQNLVGTRVKVWWPDDDMFYKGIIERFIPAKKMHQVTYDDGDIEILNLKNETWEIITIGADSDEEEGADHQSPNVSTDMPKKKKGKTSTADPKKGRNKDVSSISGGATSSKSSGKSMKSSHRSKDGSKSDRKSKVSKIAAALARDSDEVIIKTKNHTPKSGGSGKSIDAATRKKRSGKSKDIDKDDVSTPKLSGKTSAASSKAAKSSKSGGKSSANGNSKVKFKLLKDSMEDDDSEESTEEAVENTKAKKSSSLKASGGSEVKIGKKRARN